MPVQLIRRVRDRQPASFTRLSKSTTLAAGACAGAIHTQILAPNVVTGEVPVLLGATNMPTTGYGSAGVGVKTISGNYSKVPRYIIPGITNQYTFICVASVSQIGAIQSLIDADDYPVSRYMQFRVEASGVIGSIGFNTVDSVFIAYSSKSVTANIPFVAATRLSGNSLCSIISGEISAPTTISGSLKTTHPNFTIGGSQASTSFDCVDGGATIYAWVAFPYGLPDAKLIELTRSVKNFWQIFEPETIPLFWPIATAKSAAASVSAAIRSGATASASLNAAIQSAATASATLSGAIQTAQSVTSGLTAYIVASGARSSSASLSAAISDARTATSSLSAAVATARTATAALDSAIQIEATASTGASAAIREAFSLSANISGAVQASATTSASLAAVVATTNAIFSGLSAAVRAEQAASAGLSTVISASVWPEPEDVKQGVVYGPQGFDYTGEFAGGGGPITRVMQGAEPETIIKTVVKTVYVDRPADSQMPGGGLVIVDGIQITPEAAVVVATRQATIIKAQEAEIASLRSENDALSALLMATIQ